MSLERIRARAIGLVLRLAGWAIGSGWKRGGERFIEMPFALAHLPPAPRSVLDVGCCDSSFSILLAALGYEVTGLDVREFNRPALQLGSWSAADRVHLVRGDISKIPEIGGGSFDAVTIVSTLEHIGVGGRYDVAEDTGADRDAIREMARIVKPGGTVIVTVPFGRKKLIPPHCRIYDRGLLETLAASGLACDKKEFYRQDRPLCWSRTSMEEAEKLDVQVENYGLALLKLTRSSMAS